MITNDNADQAVNRSIPLDGAVRFLDTTDEKTVLVQLQVLT